MIYLKTDSLSLIKFFFEPFFQAISLSTYINLIFGGHFLIRRPSRRLWVENNTFLTIIFWFDFLKLIGKFVSSADRSFLF